MEKKLQRTIYFQSALFILVVIGFSPQAFGQNNGYRFENGKYVSSQTHEPYTGLVYEHHDNGKVKSELTVVDGKRHGQYKEWYESGRLRLVQGFNYGEADGSFLLYYKNGKTIEQKGYYSADQPFGAWSFFDKKGNLEKVLVYNESGVLTASEDFLDD